MIDFLIFCSGMLVGILTYRYVMKKLDEVEF